MSYLLDYSVCLALVGGTKPEMARRFLSCSAQELAIPSMVKAELLLTARISQRPIENTRLVEAFMAPLVSLPFDDACAEEYALIRADLDKNAAMLGASDLITAATALTHRRILITADSAAFSLIPRLKLEPWDLVGR